MSSSKYTVDFTDNKIDASQFIGGYNSWELKPQGPPVRPGNKSDAGPFYLNNITGIKCYGATSTDTFETDGLAANVSFTKGTLITMTGMTVPCRSWFSLLTGNTHRTEWRQCDKPI